MISPALAHHSWTLTPADVRRAGVSVAIFAVFTCTTFESGNSYLDADARIMCYDTVHKRYMGGAAVWLVLVPFGVPAFFLWLLHRFKVPQMAALLSDNAWLREAVKLAWAEGMAQPADAASLTVDSITTLHLEALFAFFLHDMSAEDAAEIIAGTRPPLQDTAADTKEDPERASSKSFDAAAVARRVSGALRKVAGRVNSGVSRRIVLINSVAAKVTGDDAAAARRQLLLTSLLTFLRSSGDAAVPPLTWERPLEEEVAALKQICPDAVCAHSSGLRCADVPQLMETAMAEVAFLFAAYRMDCWYWCVALCTGRSAVLCSRLRHSFAGRWWSSSESCCSPPSLRSSLPGARAKSWSAFSSHSSRSLPRSSRRHMRCRGSTLWPRLRS